ncbi:MAG: flagellar protein FlaG [Planctomycetota bacterium]
MAEMTLNPTSPIPDTAVAPPPEEAFLHLPEASQSPEPATRQEEQPPLEIEDLHQAADEMNTAMEAFNQRYRFGIYQDTDQFYVQVLDSSSGRTLRTRPVQDLLELRRRLQDMVGLVVDEEL